MDKIDISEIARFALQHSRTIVPSIAPGGSLSGDEYSCATVNGQKGTSCKINIRTGKWADFSTDQKGGDLVSLWAAAYGVSQLDAAKQLGDKLGFRFEKMPARGTPAKAADFSHVQSETAPVLEFDLAPIPDTVKEPTFLHSQLGPASAHWCYYGAGGERLFWIARYDTKEGKQFTPLSWDQKRLQLVPKAWPDPRPLYGLRELSGNPGAPSVLIVEGEKAAEAARQIFPSKHYNVVTWSGGSKAWTKSDWTPLFGKKILIWPDHDLKRIKTDAQAKKYGSIIGDLIPLTDQPGFAAAIGIAEILAPHCEVKYFSLDQYAPVNGIDGFDAADALEMGWTFQTCLDVIKPIVKTYVPKPVETPTKAVEKIENNEWIQGSHSDAMAKLNVMATDNGKVFNHMANVARMIQNHPNLGGKIWFDEFHLRFFTNWKTPEPVEWSDSDDLSLLRVFQEQFKLHQMKLGTIKEGVKVYAMENRRNEPRDWLNAQVWDDKCRIDEFFINVFGAEMSSYTVQASKNFWIAMVARIFHPGCKMDNMVILEGKQGAYKSSALKAIAGAKWFTECNEAVTSKDFKHVLVGRMIVEIAELSSLLKGANQEDIKSILSTASDNFRPPYGSHPQTFNRTCIFVGTTNDTEYLDDPTGGRRYWPIKVKSIDLKYIEENRAQLFAEAVHRYKSGESWWEMPEEETLAIQASRRIVDPWEQPLRNWITFGRGRDQNDVLLSQFTRDELFMDDKDVHPGIYRRLGKIMRSLGWDNKLKRVDGHPIKVWSRPSGNDFH